MLMAMRERCLPVSQVWVGIGLWVLPDVVGGWVAWRIAGHEVIGILILVLVDSDVVDAH
jgi:hypothetical protein